MRMQFISCGHDAAQSFVIRQVVKFSLILRVESCQELIAQSFFLTPGTLMKIAVDDNFVTIPLQAPEPCDKLPVFCEEALMMIVGNHEKRTDTHTVTGEFCNDRSCNFLVGRGDVVQRNHDKIPRRFSRCNQWKKLGCRNGAHPVIFGSPAALNKTKAQGATFQVASVL